jgi:hypothetical protein
MRPNFACVIAWQFWNAPSGEAPSCGVCKHDAAANGRPLRLTAAFRYFECETTTRMCRGRSCSTFGACQNFR